MKLRFKLVFALLAVTPSAFANDTTCNGFVDFAKNNYFIKMDCQDLTAIRTFKLGNPGKQMMSLAGRDYGVELLAGFNANMLVCGRDRDIQKYTDEFGMPRNTDITRDQFVKIYTIPPELILPVPQGSIAENEDLKAIYLRYLEAGMNDDASLDNAAQVKAMTKTRNEFWSNGLESLVKKSGCTDIFCQAIAGVSKDGAVTDECKKSMKKIKPDDFYLKLTLAKGNTAGPTSVVGPNTKKIDDKVDTGTGGGTTNGTQGGGGMKTKGTQ